jgi:hypothetical protein
MVFIAALAARKWILFSPEVRDPVPTIAKSGLAICGGPSSTVTLLGFVEISPLSNNRLNQPWVAVESCWISWRARQSSSAATTKASQGVSIQSAENDSIFIVAIGF